MVEFSHKSSHKKHHQYTEHPLFDPQRTRFNPANLNRTVCFSFAAYACSVISHLSKSNVPIARGLSDEEFQQIQARFGFDFPPDLRSILQEGLPVGAGFPDWRSSPAKQLLNMINLPAKGLCKEVLRGTFWCKHWGDRPDSLEGAARIAKMAMKSAPVLVPIYSHCYIPCFPNLSGNPIFFIFEKDVFYCGYDLADFFGREVFMPVGASLTTSERPAYGDKIAVGWKHLSNSSWEKRWNKGTVEEVMETKSKPKAVAYVNNDRSVGRWNDHSQNQHLGHHELGHNHDYWYQSRNSHRRSVKEVKWEALNQRLLAELQNAETTRVDDTVSRKSLCEEPLQYRNCPPKSLVRSAGNSPRMGQDIMSRYAYFHEKPLPAKVLAQFTIAAPPWAAKMARHIPMWSDLAEDKETVCHASVSWPQDVSVRRLEHVKVNIMKQSNGGKKQENSSELNHGINSRIQNVVQSKGSAYDWTKRAYVDTDIAQSHGTRNALHDHDVHLPQEFEFCRAIAECADDQVKQGSCKPNRRWLVPYLKDIEKTLRRGGWKQGEIEEMVAALPPDDECFSLIETQRDIQEFLNSSANVMSSSLQKAGWSEPDVVEILSL